MDVNQQEPEAQEGYDSKKTGRGEEGKIEAEPKRVTVEG